MLTTKTESLVTLVLLFSGIVQAMQPNIPPSDLERLKSLIAQQQEIATARGTSMFFNVDQERQWELNSPEQDIVDQIHAIQDEYEVSHEQLNMLLPSSPEQALVLTSQLYIDILMLQITLTQLPPALHHAIRESIACKYKEMDQLQEQYHISGSMVQEMLLKKFLNFTHYVQHATPQDLMALVARS